MHSPARKIKKSSVKNIVRFPSSKNNRTLLLESILESQFALFLEYDNSVEAYFEQPETFLLLDENNKKHKYTPDFLVIFKNGSRKYIEVKPKEKSESPKYTKTFRLFKQKVTQSGDRFEVINEEFIQQEPFLQNLKYFYRFRNFKNLNMELLEDISSNIKRPIHFKALSEHYDLKSLYQLIAFGYIKFDIKNQPFSINAEVWLNEQ